MVYEVRETTNSNDPADRGGWWHSSDVSRGVPLLAADERGGRSVYVVRSED